MITLTDKYAIDSDEGCRKLCRHRKATKKTPEGWVAFKFYGSLSSCISSTRDFLLRNSDYDSWQDLEKNLKAINQLLERKFKGAF